MLEQRLLIEFGPMRMNEILPSHVREYLMRLGNQGASVHTVQKRKTVLSAIFTTALNDQVIHLRPCDNVHISPVPVTLLQVLTPTELDALLSALPVGCQNSATGRSPALIPHHPTPEHDRQAWRCDCCT